MPPVSLVLDHDQWASAFLHERSALHCTLGSTIQAVEHVGSTSIYGVPAKPVLDILIAVSTFESTLDVAMEQLGYEARGEYGIPRRRYFVKGDPRTHHVHIFEASNPEWRAMLHFRNALRGDSELATEYAAAKVRLAELHASNKSSYQAAKDRVVAAMLARIQVPFKVCPVVLRSAEILAFRHPQAGVQLVKGTVEPGEDFRAAALRELAEESGITAATIRVDLGWWPSDVGAPVWSMHLCHVDQPLSESWVHHALEDTGMDFAFFWQHLASEDFAGWHPVHANAVRFVRRNLVYAGLASRNATE